MKFHSDSSARRIFKNGVFTAVRFGIYMLSGIFFIPFLVRHYGTGTYGLIALAGFLTQYVGLVSRCVGNATARFLNIALNQHDDQQANEIFSTALIANLGFIILQIPWFVVGIWKLDWLIDFPPEIASDFRFLVACNAGVFFISMMSGVFSTPIQAANRLDISSTLDGLKITIRLCVLFILIKSVGAKLWLIGVVDLSLALVNLTAVYFMSRKLARDLVFRWRHVTRKWVKPLLNMAGWSIVTALGGYLFVKTDVWMINRFVNKEMAGVYAALLVWPNFLRQLSKQLASILAPVYMIDYARGDIARVARLSFSSAKLLGCFVTLLIGGLFVLAEPLLDIWLGSGASVYVPLFRVMIVYLAFTIGEGVLWQIYTTLNKVHITGTIAVISGVLNIILSLSLIRAGFGAMGVAIGTAISIGLSSGLAIPLGICREFKLPYKTIGWNYTCAALMFPVSFVPTTAALYILDTSLAGAIGVFTVLFSGGLLLAMKVILSDAEKLYFGEAIQKLRTRLRPHQSAS